ncbi:MAG: hypothetical protein LBU62_09125 [Bacteroidales bacterium]|jgi:predicted nucleic acid-binding protein|nr:hypothetical protein [Bacteroidales bacterium]
MKQRIYIDTSVVGGYFDEEFSEATVSFFESVKQGKVVILVSELLDKELIHAPVHVRMLLETIPSNCIERLTLVPEAKLLASHYVEANVVGKTSLDDCQHIAMATICKADVLASWNFKHIVNLKRINGYNGINVLRGYKPIEIRTPKEIISYEND